MTLDLALGAGLTIKLKLKKNKKLYDVEETKCQK